MYHFIFCVSRFREIFSAVAFVPLICFNHFLFSMRSYKYFPFSFLVTSLRERERETVIERQRGEKENRLNVIHCIISTDKISRFSDLFNTKRNIGFVLHQIFMVSKVNKHHHTSRIRKCFPCIQKIPRIFSQNSETFAALFHLTFQWSLTENSAVHMCRKLKGFVRENMQCHLGCFRSVEMSHFYLIMELQRSGKLNIEVEFENEELNNEQNWYFQ